jgi:hypothetical protein
LLSICFFFWGCKVFLIEFSFTKFIYIYIYIVYFAHSFLCLYVLH